MRRAEIVAAVILGLFSLYVMWKSGEPPEWNPDAARFDNIHFIEGEGPGSGFWPFWLAGAMLVSCVWIAINWYRRLSPQSRSDAAFLDNYAKKMLLLVGVGLLGFLFLIEWAGFYVAIALFLIYYLRFLGRHSMTQTLLIALITPVVFFFFFDVTMRIFLPKGYLEPLFIPLYDIFL